MLGRLLSDLGLAETACSNCGSGVEDGRQGYLCERCLGELKPHHPIDYRRLEYITSYRVFGVYGGVLAEVLRLIKFRSVRPLARILGEAVREHMGEFVEETSPDLITFVPVHLLRFWGRGFDHNREILRGSGFDFEEVLLRLRYARPLASYGKEERMRMVRGAFGIRKEYVDKLEGKRVLVFDDILTTGATSRSVAESILSVGASEVFFYFVAKEG